MKFRNLISLCFVVLFSLGLSAQKVKFSSDVERQKIDDLLLTFNTSAAKADFKTYFDCFAKESTFIGTDATEVWNKKAFMDWAKPFFEAKKTWDFTSLKRNVYFSKDGKYAWFDELLDTQMKICRGSGVLEKINGQWKVKQYVLSMTIPNDVVTEVVKVKSPIEDGLLKSLK
ncbi:nuclear transport factor 2 family protein [Soonwooa sp.]|uniref:nuclear transport factor 2 family protein n=1 Tax=Soonwooa sp. TaxID=1938592 RepID=UPI002634A80E|nr:nuclear transport factor 2 family protein [Soonwooa sp.]